MVAAQFFDLKKYVRKLEENCQFGELKYLIVKPLKLYEVVQN